jgi:osmotically-inducible protein OsmY
MRRFVAPIFLASSLLAWAACSTTSPQGGTVKLSDSEIEDQVKARLKASPLLSDSKADVDVDADVKDKSLTLSGNVESEAIRAQVMDVARAAQPDFILKDKMEVKPREVSLEQYTEDMAKGTRDAAKAAGDKLGDSLEDAWIHTKVTAKLAANKATPAHKINVDVVKKDVTLRGEVESAEARVEAARIAGETEGVRRVRNLLRVKPGGTD